MRTGTVYTDTIVHLAPERFAADVPYQVVIVTLDNGGRVTARIDGPNVAIDDRVIEVESREGIPVFKLAAAVAATKPRLDYIIEQIAELNPLHGKRLKKNMKRADEAYRLRAQAFLLRYEELLKGENRGIDYGIDCYLQMIADVNYESMQFMTTGEYTSTSFDEVNKRVYANPGVMEYYMHGLLMSQFLWPHHYDILLYFNALVSKYKSGIGRYLEVGGGHGLYISEALSIIGDRAAFQVVDISRSSLDIAKKMVASEKVSWLHSDIFEYFPPVKFDFITMGEVMEHVEDPVKLLAKLHSLLADDGRVLVTTPTNAPAIDHIYLFRNADDIRNVISQAGFKVCEERCIWSEDLPVEIMEEMKISMMYVGLLMKQ